MNKKQILMLAGVLIAGIIIGMLINSGSPDEAEEAATEENGTVYTCSMHPDVRSTDPDDKCPICGMDLVPMGDTGEPTGPTEVRMTERAMKIANVQTSPVETTIPRKTIRLNGQIEVDERNEKIQPSHIPGRIEVLHINYTGQWVTKGQLLAEIYSPELVTAQREFIDALENRDIQPGMAEASREKLKQWKISESQIREIEESREVRRTFPVHADHSGYVVKRKKDEGDYVKQGDGIYSIVSLHKVWAVFEAYENQLSWINTGDTITFRQSSRPGEMQQAIIEFIDPVIDRNKRIARVRATLPNPLNALRPGTFLEGSLKGTLYDEPQMVVPHTAVMWTGPRSVVYVRDPDSEEPIFSYREVTIGEDLGDAYVIKDGIEVGERIAVYGTFRIDAAAQLAAKASMMRPKADEDKPLTFDVEDHKGHTPEAFQSDMQVLFDAYTELSDALADDDPGTAHEKMYNISKALEILTSDRLEGKAHELFFRQREAMIEAIHAMHESDLKGMRIHFEHISLALRAAIESFGIKDTEVYVLHCPMAFDNRGADWLYDKEEIYNPYFGDVMLRCGEVKDKLTN